MGRAPPTEGLWSRARDDTRTFCLSFRGLSLEVVLGGIGATLGAFLTADPDTSTRVEVLLAGASAVVGFFAVVVVALGVFLLLAPVRQRDEAREGWAESRAEGEGQLVEARQDAGRQLAEAGKKADTRVAQVEGERDAALRRVEELKAPADDPDPRIALANRAEHRAAQLRAVCIKAEVRMSATRDLRAAGFTDKHGDREEAEGLAEYERDHSIETREIFDQLIAEGVIDLEERGHPEFLNDVRTVAKLMQEAAAELRARGAKPLAKDRAQLLREEYQRGVRVRTGNIWTEGAPITEEESAEGKRRAWERATDWGVETWEMLLQHFPGHAERAFFGSPETYALGRLGFQMNASAERDAGGTVDSYMEPKLAILADLLERERP